MADLPRGTVTFLFTDIKGSTALWERDRAAMGTAVARHRVLVRTDISEHDGVLFKVVGAVHAGVPTSSQSAAAALGTPTGSEASIRGAIAHAWSVPVKRRSRACLPPEPGPMS